MNLGLLRKSLIETWKLTVVFGAALAVVEGFLAFALNSFQGEISGVLVRLPFVQDLVRALIGADAGDAFGPSVFRTIAWVHPTPLAIAWAHATIISTRVPAGEIDRGTADVFLAMPVSRLQVFACDGVTAIGWCLLLTVLLLAGNLIGGLAAGAEAADPLRLAAVLANFLLLDLAVAGLGYLASALSDTRGMAIGLVFAVLIGSFLLNFLATIWPPAKTVEFLGLLRYYKPLGIIEGGAPPLADMCILAAAGAGTWGLGAWIFERRDVVTR